MDSHTGQHQRFPAVIMVAVLFVLCIIPGQFYLAKQFPDISGLVQIKPSLVFLDIPTPLPFNIDLILAPALFMLVYPLVLLFFPGRGAIGHRLRAAFTGFVALLFCMLAGGLIYYLVQDQLPANVKNGINSMGINADIHIPFAGFETINLRGSLILFICFNIGLFILVRKIRKQPAAQLTREQRMTPYQRMLREKRMQQKQTMEPARKMQTEDYNDAAYNNANLYKSFKPKGLGSEAVQHGYQGQSHVCWCQPVMSIKPEAIYYMPAK